MRGQEPRVQPPALEAYSDQPLFNTKAVVHVTGVPAPTLRAWERRYGILTPRRGQNAYRLYSEQDIATVSWLRERVQTGMTIRQAIALLKSLEPGRSRRRRAARGGRAEGMLHTNGSNASALPRSSPSSFALGELRAALQRHLAGLDEPAALQTIMQALAVYPVEEVCLQVLEPVLAEIGRLWAEGQISVIVEHFSAALVRAQLESLFRSVGRAGSGPLILVGCAPGELHELGPLMLALFLRRAGLRVAYLGQTVELESLLAAVSALRPGAVLLSAALPAHVVGLGEVGRRLSESVGPRPFFGFGGQVFSSTPDLQGPIAGTCLGTDAQEAVRVMIKRLSA